MTTIIDKRDFVFELCRGEIQLCEDQIQYIISYHLINPILPGILYDKFYESASSRNILLLALASNQIDVLSYALQFKSENLWIECCDLFQYIERYYQVYVAGEVVYLRYFKLLRYLRNIWTLDGSNIYKGILNTPMEDYEIIEVLKIFDCFKIDWKDKI